MDLSIFKQYEQSLANYDKAKALLDKAEQQKQDNFHAILKYLEPLVIKELIATGNVDDYYLKGEGRIVAINFFLKESTLDVMYGFLAEDDIFPSGVKTLQLHLFKF